MMTILNIQHKNRFFTEIIPYLFQVCMYLYRNMEFGNRHIQLLSPHFSNTSGYFYKLACYVWEVITLIERGFPRRKKI